MKPKSVVSRLFDGNTELSGETHAGGARYQRQVDSSERLGSTAPGDGSQAENGNKKKETFYREVHFAFLPERYEPLIEEDEARERAKEEKKNKKKETYKKVKKNFGKALRYSWKCLILGLHSFAAGYSTPLSAASTLIPEFQAGRARG